MYRQTDIDLMRFSDYINSESLSRIYVEKHITNWQYVYAFI